MVSKLRIRSTKARLFEPPWLMALRRLLGVVCLFVIIPCCKSDPQDPQTGTETNFLGHCDGTCGEGLTCLCGVCTKACTGANECAPLGASALCVPVVGQPDSGTAASCQQGATCDKVCVNARDCADLGTGYQCETGFCRKGNMICPGNALPPGDASREILVNGTSRAYLLHVPPSYSGNTPVPLVIDLHPLSLDAQWEKANSGFLALSDQEGFIAAWPQGIEITWNMGPCCTSSRAVDDFGFARALVRQLSTEACVDPKRVYAVGFSMGGSMAYYLACTEAEIFASIAVSSMDLFADSELACQPSRAVSEISFRGTADTVVQYAGGSGSPPGHPEFTNELLGAVGTFQKWAAIDQCTGSPTAEDANGCSTYSTCQDGTEVALCTSQGGGQVMGDAAIAWNALKRHPMP
jgi:polyhydroxybutyrate depolymerase